MIRKSFLGTPDILSGYLGCSPDSGLSTPNFRMVIGRFRRILSMKNEKYSVFPKRDAVKALVKGSKKPKNGLFSNFSQRLLTTCVPPEKIDIANLERTVGTPFPANVIARNPILA